MINEAKLMIYKGIILYVLESTHYTIKDIADLCNTSIKNIRTIFIDEEIPAHFLSEIELLQLYHFTLTLNLKASRGHQ
jgi:hypothetical protein